MVIEELDFETKNDNMLYEKYNHMSSKLAYEKIQIYVVRWMYNDEVATSSVNRYMISKDKKVAYPYE